MGMTNFININYVNILLILGLTFAIVLTKSYKEKQNRILLFLIVISTITVILTFLVSDYSKIKLNDQGYKTTYIMIFIFQPIEIFFLLLSFLKINARNVILLSVPSLINLSLMIVGSSNDLILNINDGNVLKGTLFYFELGVCLFYFLIAIIIGMILVFKKQYNDFIIIALISSINIFALIFGAFNLTFSISNSSIIFGAILYFVSSYVKTQTSYSANQEKLIQEQKTSLTISQIQPHFLYNALATIGYLCKKDPNTASKALDEFSDYLRANLNALSQKNNVPFLEELKHVKTYVWLEQLRFEDRLEVEYDIEFTDFFVPALSIQPLVENAIKHGICEKPEGGKLTLRTIPYNEYVKVIIEDNGIGFKPNENLNDGRSHVGIENVKSRLKSMSNATLEIQSTVGKGTVATITLPRS